MFEFAIVLLVLGLIGAGILRQHLRDAKLLRLREIDHRERMTAMENNGALPDSRNQSLEELLAGSVRGGWDRNSRVLWVRLAALGLGLTCLFGGIGTAIGLPGVSDPEASGMFSIGFIPVFIGFGLLLFYRMSKGAASTTTGGPDSGEDR